MQFKGGLAPSRPPFLFLSTSYIFTISTKNLPIYFIHLLWRKGMNYLIYLGIFCFGGMFGAVIMALLSAAGRRSESLLLEGLLMDNYQQNKIDERCNPNNKQTA
jgi:hypothetical protein